MTERKLERLRNDLLKKGSITVALSGGVDSIFLLEFASEVLKEKAKAVTAVAPNFAPDEIEYARNFCEKRGIALELAEVSLMDEIRENGRERCYFCKRKLFETLIKYGDNLADGTNFDDLSDYRPGIKALEEMGIWSPLKDAELTKDEIRKELKRRKIDIFDKPSFACLASRIPYGSEITEEKLFSVFKVEQKLRDIGFTQVRARHHGDVVRIELLPSEWDISKFEEIDNAGKEAGFKYTALDLEGYKMGRMNG